MENVEKKVIELTGEELEQYNAFKAEQAKKDAKEQAKKDREAYRDLVDETIEKTIPALVCLSKSIKATKQAVLDNFKDAIEMKSDVLKLKKDGQRSDTFTNSKSDKRIIVKEYIEGLASDEKTKALVKMVLRLLARDAKGTLKASRVVQLRKIAEETESERFMEGVQIIEEAYQPAISKQFVRAEMKNENGKWVCIPLGMTES